MMRSPVEPPRPLLRLTCEAYRCQDGLVIYHWCPEEDWTNAGGEYLPAAFEEDLPEGALVPMPNPSEVDPRRITRTGLVIPPIGVYEIE